MAHHGSSGGENMSQTSIEWTDVTWNPVRGCVKVSPGCKHCYAETFAERFRGVSGHPYEQGFDPRLVPEKLAEPLRWRKGRRVFVNSMSDLFGEFVPDDYIAAVFGVMVSAHWHVFQVLTKRAERLPLFIKWLANQAESFSHLGSSFARACLSCVDVHAIAQDFARPTLPRRSHFPFPNVHLGVSVEDRKYGLPRIEHLRKTPAAVRFLSIEPLLEDLGRIDLTGIHQVIVGAESGRGARPMNEDWVRSIRDQCVAQGVPFFYKQKLDSRGHKVSLPVLDGRQWAEEARTV